MSTEDRRFSVTLSEDDLRPHMRKIRDKPEKSEISKLVEKFEKREKEKESIRKKIEEEQREKEEERRKIETRKELDALWHENSKSYKTTLGKEKAHQFEEFNLPKNRRYNNSRYFNWDSDEDGLIPEVPRPPALDSPNIEPRSHLVLDDTCELCNLALKALEKKPAEKIAGKKSSACTHIDNFLASALHKF